MKLVHLMLTHTPTPHALKLIDHLAASSTLVVHVDTRVDESLYELEDRGAIACERRVRVRWGGASMVYAMVELLRTAAPLLEPDDYAVLVSGDSYPLQSPEGLLEFFHASDGLQYIDAYPMPAPKQALTRLSRRFYEFDSSDGSLHVRKRALNYLRLPRLWRRRFEGFPPHAGSQWFALTGAAVRHLLDVIERRPDLLEFIRLSHVPDEFFFQTLMKASPFAEQLRPSLMLTDWSADGDHPAVITLDHVARLAATPNLEAQHRGIGPSPVVYARKFPAISTRLTRAVEEQLWSRAVQPPAAAGLGAGGVAATAREATADAAMAPACADRSPVETAPTASAAPAAEPDASPVQG